MTDTPRPPPSHDVPDDIPAAVVAPRRRWSLPLVWLVPLVALVVGAWLGVNAILQQGPTVTITFLSGEGLETGRTRIKYKEVDVGVVKNIRLSEDRSAVVVTAELSRDTKHLLVEDTRFWVVKPRIASGGVSGLGTLLSGAYIGMDAGKSQESQDSFVGLEVPPILTAGLPGREFVLKAADLGSLNYGTPVYYRRVEVGEVIAYKLDEDGKGVTARIFVHAPYDRYVTANTRFWSASGVDVSLTATGLQVDTESLVSIVRGGVAFASLPESAAAPPATAGRAFTLHANRGAAFKREDTRVERYLLVFRESVHGLQIGAPVEFRGIPIGDVVDIGVDYDPVTKQTDIPVEIRLYPDRLRARRNGNTVPSPEQHQREFQGMVDAGFRAQLRTASLITGQLYVALDFFPAAKKVRMDWSRHPVEIPTLAGGLQELQTTVTSIAAKLDRIPYEQISRDLRQALQSLDKTLKEVDTQMEKFGTDVTPEIRKTLEEARRTLGDAGRTLGEESPLKRDLAETLREVTRAAESLRTLTDYLDRHPEAIIRGRPSEEKQ